MSLNESKGNMYEFVTHTWNAIKGKCPHECSYCYMKRWGEQSELHLDENELRADLGKGNFIFVGSSCDMFAAGIPVRWVEATLAKCISGNQYLFQSKNPGRILHHIVSGEMPHGSILCTTLETNYRMSAIMRQSPHPQDRARWLSFISSQWRKMIAIEPIMNFNLHEFVDMIKRCGPEQVNIGADTGNNHLPEPSKDDVLRLIDELSKFTKVVQKKNLARLLK